MANQVLIQKRVAATNIDSYNRTVICASAVHNGGVFRLETQSSTAGESEVWTATTGSSTHNIWMAYSPEVVITNSQYKGLDPDPRNFTNVANKVFDAFRPMPGDVLVMTGDDMGGTAKTAYANSGSSNLNLQWAAASVANSLSLKYLGTIYVSLGTGAIDDQRVAAYKFEVISNPSNV